jgi:hypothetical protein
MAKEGQIYEMMKKVLVFTLQTIQYKALIANVVSIVNRTIICVKSASPPEDQTEIEEVLALVLDVLAAGSTQHKENQENSLRILQSAFSLIDHTLVVHFNKKMSERMFSICS